MDEFDRRDWRDADVFYADLLRPLPRSRGGMTTGESGVEAEAWFEVEAEAEVEAEVEADGESESQFEAIDPTVGPHPADDAPFPAEAFSGELLEAGRVFDEIVHGGASAGELLPAEADDDSEWETIALPGSRVRPEDLPAGALVFKRALAEGRLASVYVLGSGIRIQQLFGPDGRTRADILILVRRPRFVAPGIAIAAEAEWDLRSVLTPAGTTDPAPSSAATHEGEEPEETVPQNGRGTFRHDPLGGEPGPNVEARWNVSASSTAGSTVDIVVYLHGYGSVDPKRNFLADKTDEAGVDLVDDTGAVKVRASRPTLALVPRGRPSGERNWYFDRLPDPTAFDALVEAGLSFLATTVLKLPAGSSLKAGRLTLMAHSGGGAGMVALLDKGLNPDELICFDSMYGGEDAVFKWADARINSSKPSTFALRVFYFPCSGPVKDFPAGRWIPNKKGDLVYDSPGSWSYWAKDKRWHLGSTEVSARRLQHKLDPVIAKAKGGAALAARYRVELTSVPHDKIPKRYSPLLLDDVAANMKDATPPPAASKQPVCVANSDWLSKPPVKPGGDDPPPPKPAPPAPPAPPASTP